MLKANVGMQGLLWCFTFVILDAAQAVFFGGVLQKLDGFLIGGLVFGLSSIGCILWTCFRTPYQIKIARQHGAPLLGLNLSAAGGWLTYFNAIQLIEPAVAFAIFSGIIPIATIIASHLGFAEAEPSRNSLEALGNAVLVCGLLLLAGLTLLGWSGFVRGAVEAALMGLYLAAISGILIAMMLLYSQRLDGHGLAPVTQFGLRFPIYLLLTFVGYALGIDHKGPVPITDVLAAVGIGMIVLAFPIYAVQKAVSLTSSLTIGSVAAMAPLIVFLMQTIEGRVDYSHATSLGLSVYFLGAMIAALGSVRAVATQREAVK